MSILQACEPEPRAASLKRFPPKNPKTGIMPQYGISYMRGTSYNYANTRGTFYQTAPTKGNRTLTILIPFPNYLHTCKRSRAENRFVTNGKANFGSPIEGNPKYSGQKKPKWIFHLTSTEISFRDLWHKRTCHWKPPPPLLTQGDMGH